MTSVTGTQDQSSLWLQQHNKRPYATDDYPFWYWGTDEDACGDAAEDDYLLPAAVFNMLTQRTTYSNRKSYWTQEDALVDYRQAFAKAVQSGWSPVDSA